MKTLFALLLLCSSLVAQPASMSTSIVVCNTQSTYGYATQPGGINGDCYFRTDSYVWYFPVQTPPLDFVVLSLGLIGGCSATVDPACYSSLPSTTLIVDPNAPNFVALDVGTLSSGYSWPVWLYQHTTIMPVQSLPISQFGGNDLIWYVQHIFYSDLGSCWFTSNAVKFVASRPY